VTSVSATEQMSKRWLDDLKLISGLNERAYGLFARNRC
jgi:hypothetical protein